MDILDNQSTADTTQVQIVQHKEVPVEEQYFDEVRDTALKYEDYSERQHEQFFNDEEYGLNDQTTEYPKREYYPKEGFHWTDPDDHRHYGGCCAFAYWNGQPLCVIGPDCKLYLNQLSNSKQGHFLQL